MMAREWASDGADSVVGDIRATECMAGTVLSTLGVGEWDLAGAGVILSTRLGATADFMIHSGATVMGAATTILFITTDLG